MTEAQETFVELDKKKAEYKLFLEQYRQAVNTVKEEIGLGGHFQDYEGIVYQVHDCEGKFVPFDKLEIKRTKRSGERAGTLSKVKAEDMGYVLGFTLEN